MASTDNDADVLPVGSACSPPIYIRRPWGFWSTFGLSLVVGAGALIAQIVFGILWAVVMIVQGNDHGLEQLDQNGMFLLTCVMSTYPLVVGLTLLFIKVRRCDTIANYLAFHSMRWKTILPWAGWLLVYLVLSSAIAAYLDLPIPTSMIVLGQSTNLVFLVIMLIVLGPVVEELFFRGFMFKGIYCSKAGAAGAILLTSLAWVSLHIFQYSWRECTALFILGLILGFARLKTGSVVAPLFLHMVNNTFALISLMLALQAGAV